MTCALAAFLLAAVAAQAQAPFVRTIIVDGGSSATANGNALLLALSNITTNSSTNPWMIKVEPGIFDLGSSSLTLKDYVDIEGSGPGVTTITSNVARGAGNLAVVIVPSGVHSELREATVQNISTDSICIQTSSSNLSLRRLNILIPNGQVSTMGILGSGNPTFTRLNLQLSSSANTSQGIYFSGSPAINDVTITMTNTTNVVASDGFNLVGGSPVIDSAVVTVSGAQSNYGVQAVNPTVATITNSRFTTTTPGTTGAAEGIRCFGAPCTLDEVRINVSGGGSTYGIVLDEANSTVRHSVISASGASGQNNGVYIDELANAVLRDLDVQASGGSQASAVFADYANGGSNSNTVTVSDSTLAASGGTTNLGINTSGAGNTFTIVRTTATGSGGTSYGLNELSINTYTIDHSQIVGATGSVHLNSVFSAGASQLSGTVGPASGVCVDSYNGSYAALSSTCH